MGRHWEEVVGEMNVGVGGLGWPMVVWGGVWGGLWGEVGSMGRIEGEMWAEMGLGASVGLGALGRHWEEVVCWAMGWGWGQICGAGVGYGCVGRGLGGSMGGTGRE